MKIFSLFVVIASCLLVHAYQIPVQLIEGLNAEESQISVSNLMTLLNQINSEYGTLLSAERNNVTIWSGNDHVSYRNGRLFLTNSSVVTTWQIQYPNNGQKATICANIPSFTTRCWDSSSGYATVGGGRSANYIPSLIAGEFVIFAGDYCLIRSTSDPKNDLMWTYNTECLRFDFKPSREIFTSPRGVSLDAAMAGIHSNMWDPMEAIGGAFIKTVGSVIVTVAPNSDVAGRIREAGDAWGYCGSVQC